MTDIYQIITDKIVAQIEQGVSTYRMPWHSRQHGASELQLPRNVTGRTYRGVNVPVLWATASAFGYSSPIWATYKQWHERGCQVRKGEKAAIVVFWKSSDIKIGETEDGGDEIERRLIARGYFVFNAAQVDGFDETKIGRSVQSVEDLSEDQRIAAAERFFVSSGATVRHGGNRAFYTPTGDFIQMPQFAQFVDAKSYYSVLAHEHTHWTGAKERLDRVFGARFGDAAYAFEELVAELGAAFLCAGLGLENEPRADHASYVASWLRTLKNDKKAIFKAASKAQAAADLSAIAERRAAGGAAMNPFSPAETLGLGVTAVLTLGMVNACLSSWSFTQWITLNSFVVSVLSFGAIGDGRLRWLRIFL